MKHRRTNFFLTGAVVLTLTGSVCAYTVATDAYARITTDTAHSADDLTEYPVTLSGQNDMSQKTFNETSATAGNDETDITHTDTITTYDDSDEDNSDDRTHDEEEEE
ncbi:MAG: hypothetical protein HGA67_02225 [Candidatus Yonathbacteria bacterium]|nr:hypothetical protein [Candidatus Yonathbacteria bacterium]